MPPYSSNTLYDVLGVEQSGSAEDVKKAYRKKALETHPDKLAPRATEEEKQAAEHAFHKVQEAFETLGDSQKRRTYDARLTLKSEPTTMSDETARRMTERQEWARQRKELHLSRLEEFKKKAEAGRIAHDKLRETIDVQVKLVEEIVEEMKAANPEIEARRRAVLQRKAEREREERRNRRPQSYRSWTT
ncbi:DnaJ domain-containing protein [Crucibulum laeve]|uniref:DnaJ domain-containing protein n=1 Tax=Crucibulum laeve TaxID=68775 RepID=A0A5C3M4X9_9AGAR|nr:DnaJ domain-containing protein [Crucibulum laeve]